MRTILVTGALVLSSLAALGAQPVLVSERVTLGLASTSLAEAFAAAAQAGTKAPDPDELLGIWRGPSLCTDRRAAPACKDEDAVYEFTPGARPGVVHWIADKMVDGKRQNMGESEMAYDAAERCWKAEVTSPRVTSVWRLCVSGNHLTGTARLLPGNETIRKLDLTRVVR